ncbi:uncharacterized protein UV8b_03159 [Ustilaginoidea virens]|uniref:Uncharacterized protein n=1 Tax=Ustilaginoidea virens TaxID=1159556 RepID=A0A8E5MFX9_USTVR|nr:uncharacterized protein UV8b_03159 [Ustilaginoidea virens]QUC18918.1 hypothetical protein UV8b_03159 [Ustilaginoidea virens]
MQHSPHSYARHAHQEHARTHARTHAQTMAERLAQSLESARRACKAHQTCRSVGVQAPRPCVLLGLAMRRFLPCNLASHRRRHPLGHDGELSAARSPDVYGQSSRKHGRMPTRIAVMAHSVP